MYFDVLSKLSRDIFLQAPRLPPPPPSTALTPTQTTSQSTNVSQPSHLKTSRSVNALSSPGYGLMQHQKEVRIVRVCEPTSIQLRFCGLHLLGREVVLFGQTSYVCLYTSGLSLQWSL